MHQITFIISLLFPATLFAQNYSIKIQPSNNKFKEVEYFIWIPENVKTIKGIIVHQHGCGESAYKSGRNAYYDLQWRALAKKWDFALMGSSYTCYTDCFEWINPEEGSYDAFIRGISAIAKKSDHAELENVPWVIWGHSGGGHWAYKMVLQHPDKVICAVLKSPAWTDTSSLGLQVPLLCLLGIRESFDTFSGFVYSSAVESMKYRIKGNAPVCIAPDPFSGHESADSRLLAIPFIDEILKFRVDESNTQVSRDNQCYLDLENYKITDNSNNITLKNNWNWFPDRIFAGKWFEFTKTGKVTDTTPPSEPPYNVEVRKEGHIMVISWLAVADIEGGIKDFRIYRNNTLINGDPLRSRWNFQIDYHDTPVENQDKFEFADSTILDNKEYEYQISIVNQAGLESTKSKPVLSK
jgi:pimeloyl-ACP methyl ester carboxylesterase